MFEPSKWYQPVEIANNVSSTLFPRWSEVYDEELNRKDAGTAAEARQVAESRTKDFEKNFGDLSFPSAPGADGDSEVELIKAKTGNASDAQTSTHDTLGYGTMMPE